MKKKFNIFSVIVITLLIISVWTIGNTRLNDGVSERVVYKENLNNGMVIDSKITSLYIWEIDGVNLTKLKDEVDYLNVNTLYVQQPIGELQIERFKQIIEFAKLENLNVFMLGGSSETRDALTTGDKSFVTNLIDETAKLNQELDYKIKGVILDIEFYLVDDYENGSDERKQELFKMYTNNTKEVCSYANNLGLGCAITLPVWLDKLNSEELDNLMNYNYDHLAFMNYFKETIMDNLNEEVEIAKKYNLNIVTITELQEPRDGILGEEDTFYNDGLDKCFETLNNLKEKYNYENLGVSYHYYKPLLELLERDTDLGIQNRYELELYPLIGGESVKVDEITISSDDENVSYIQTFDSYDNKYKVNLLSLEYGKEYVVTFKSGNSVGVSSILYNKGDEGLDNLEVAYVDFKIDDINDSVSDEEEVNSEENITTTETVVEGFESITEDDSEPPYTDAELDIGRYIRIGVIVVLIAICSEIDDMILARKY